MYWSLYILYFGSIQQQSLALLITLIMSILKSLYGVYITKNKYYIFFFLYSYIYYLIIIPTKIHALITIWDMGWGTRGKKTTFLKSYWSIFVWYCTLIIGFIYSIYKNDKFNIDYNYYRLSFSILISYIIFISLTILIEFILRYKKFLTNDIEIEYNNLLNNDNNDLEIIVDNSNYELTLTPK